MKKLNVFSAHIAVDAKNIEKIYSLLNCMGKIKSFCLQNNEDDFQFSTTYDSKRDKLIYTMFAVSSKKWHLLEHDHKFELEIMEINS